MKSILYTGRSKFQDVELIDSGPFGKARIETPLASVFYAPSTYCQPLSCQALWYSAAAIHSVRSLLDESPTKQLWPQCDLLNTFNIEWRSCSWQGVPCILRLSSFMPAAMEELSLCLQE